METNEGRDVEKSDADEEKVKIGVKDIGFFIIRIIGCLIIIVWLWSVLVAAGVARFASLAGGSLSIGEVLQLVLIFGVPLLVGMVLLKITEKYKFSTFAKKVREVASKHSSLADAFTKKRDVLDALLDVAIVFVAAYGALDILLVLLQIIISPILTEIGVAKIVQYSFSFVWTGLGALILARILPDLVVGLMLLFGVMFAVRWFKGNDINTASGWLASLVMLARGGELFITSIIKLVGGDPNVLDCLLSGLLGLVLCASAVGMFYAMIFRPIRRTGKNSDKDKSTDKTAGGRIESMEDAGGGNGVKVEEKKKELPPLLSAEPEEPEQKPNAVAEAPTISHNRAAETSAQPEEPTTPTATAA